jgi:hypothetical protein
MHVDGHSHNHDQIDQRSGSRWTGISILHSRSQAILSTQANFIALVVRTSMRVRANTPVTAKEKDHQLRITQIVCIARRNWLGIGWTPLGLHPSWGRRYTLLFVMEYDLAYPTCGAIQSATTTSQAYTSRK